MKTLRDIAKILLVCLIVPSGVVLGQQDAEPHYTQYMFNRIMINPATTGLHEGWDIDVFYRNQWTAKMPGAPVNQLITLQNGVKSSKMGFGGFIMNDKLGLENRLNIGFSGAYHIRSETSTYSFGLQSSLRSYFLNTSELDAKDRTDTDIYGYARTPVIPDFAFGFNYTYKNFYAGLASTHLNQSRFRYTVSLDKSNLRRHFYFNTGYNYALNPAYTLKPSIMLRYVNQARPVVDLSTVFDIQRKYWIGLNYRTGDAIGVILGVDLDQLKVLKYDIKIGYAYDYTVSKLPRYNSGSHEIMLTYTSKKQTKPHVPKFRRLEF